MLEAPTAASPMGRANVATGWVPWHGASVHERFATLPRCYEDDRTLCGAAALSDPQLVGWAALSIVP